MSAELFFIYDSHCPWSYAATQLVNRISDAFPKMPVNLMHCAYFDGDNKVSKATINAVKEASKVKFSPDYLTHLETNKDSTLAANVLTWVQRKSPQNSLALLNSIQQAHFEQANPLTTKEQISPLIDELKLSPPAKTLQAEKLTKDAEFALGDVEELQKIIGTNAIPALLLAQNENLVLLNHNLYLAQPEKIVEAVKLELAK
ncbi:hypothetical protein tinsulaeT_05380 [Thalassotalea insulae]|uniref:Protein-disulfide isomerase n=1 Tax=Thalassotalea insulae TaxID=2056778 RepID=A0ABQ6GMH5_9GAMM|nr:hypothetical protein [Thalassotalea insulae]GLX77198.1 hypothetical protein tinsulaeT_05380 [Thalassotalea insulae]